MSGPMKQQEQQLGEEEEQQVLNTAGGLAYRISPEQQLMRFLVMGVEEKNMYTPSASLKLENAMNVKGLVEGGQGLLVVERVVEVSEGGRAAKQDPGLFVLALCVALGGPAVRDAALAALPRVARTASTLFSFLTHLSSLSPASRAAAGQANPRAAIRWGRALRRAVAAWYLERSPRSLAGQVTKYSGRAGWTHADVLRLAHPDPAAWQAAKRRKVAAAAAVGAGAGAEGEGDEAAAVAVPAAAALPADSSAVAEAVAAVTEAVAAVGVEPAAGVGQKRPHSVHPDDAVRVAEQRLVLAYAARGEVPAESEGEEKGEGAKSVGPYLCAAHLLRKRLQLPPYALTPQAQAAAKAAKAAKAGRARGGHRAIGARVFGRRGSDGDEVRDENGQHGLEGGLSPEGKAVVAQAVELIQKFGFGWEHVGDQRLLRCASIWSAFLRAPGGGMGLTALTRNLGRMSAAGVFSHPECVAAAESALKDPDAIASARLHPITLLEAQRVYASGRGAKGGLSWRPLPALEAALEAAFYASFTTLAPTGRRFLIAVDVSGSMDGNQVCGMAGLTAREAATAVSMALVRAETPGHVTSCAFAGRFSPMPITPTTTLPEALATAQRLGRHMDGTDCALPMRHALGAHLPVDVFVVLTDNETLWAAQTPTQALRAYRASGIHPGAAAAKLLVCAFSSTSFTIADPNDLGMMDIAGMDSAVPAIMAQFATGQL